MLCRVPGPASFLCDAGDEIFWPPRESDKIN